jgi:hypothetical protein
MWLWCAVDEHGGIARKKWNRDCSTCSVHYTERP